MPDRLRRLDPIVLSHANALMKSARGGACQYIQADIRDPGRILRKRPRRGLQPAGRRHDLDDAAVYPDSDHPHEIVQTLVDAVPSGSYLTISDVVLDLEADAKVAASADNLNEEMKNTRQNLRSIDQLAAFFSGLEMVEPGLVAAAPVAARRARQRPGPQSHPVRVLRHRPQADRNQTRRPRLRPELVQLDRPLDETKS